LRTSLSVEQHRRGWIEGLDGRRVPTEADYKALNRIVTASEAIICKHWLRAVYTELCARFRYGPEGDAYLVLWIHDELVVCCRPTIAEQVGELLVRHACAAGESYGFRVPLAAEFKIGRDWAGTPATDNTINPRGHGPGYAGYSIYDSRPTTPITANDDTPITTPITATESSILTDEEAGYASDF
jgi:hypothetical protein